MARKRKRHRNHAAPPVAPQLHPIPTAAPEAAVFVPALDIRAAASGADVLAIHRFMLDNAVAEMAEVPVDSDVYLEHIAGTARDGVALMATVDGELVGYLGIRASRYCYAQEQFLHDDGLYVLPRHRDGDVFMALLQEAKGIAEHAGMILKIIDTNPTKARRPKGRAVTAAIIGYRPHGRIITHYPN